MLELVEVVGGRRVLGVPIAHDAREFPGHHEQAGHRQPLARDGLPPVVERQFQLAFPRRDDPERDPGFGVAGVRSNPAVVCVSCVTALDRSYLPCLDLNGGRGPVYCH